MDDCRVYDDEVRDTAPVHPRSRTRNVDTARQPQMTQRLYDSRDTATETTSVNVLIIINNNNKINL